jgi:SAM-dependent methyltransferase
MLKKTISKISGQAGERATIRCRQAELELFEYNPNAEFLDCGCRDGEFTLKKAAKIGTKKIRGIEILEKTAVIAQARGIKVYRRDLQKGLPFENETLDVVSASQIIEHLPDTDGFLREVNRVLKKGGYVIISTPNLASLDSILLLIGGWQPASANVSEETCAGVFSLIGAKICIDDGPRHQRLFTLKALRELMQYHGFTIVREHGSGFYPLPLPFDRICASINRHHATFIVIKAKKL